MPKHSFHTDFGLIEVKGCGAADLLADLQAEHYEGSMTRAVTDQLWLYGWVVLHACLSDGRIAQLGRGPGARELTERDLERLTVRDTRDDLVHTTLEGAMDGFLRGLKDGKYNPEKGATIATYFTGYILRRFRSTIHPKWANETMKREYELGQIRLEDEWYFVAQAVPDHADAVLEDLVVRRAAVRVVKDIANLNERPVALGILRGQTHSEIAAELKITVKAVERRLASLRKKAWKYSPTDSSSPAADDDDTSEDWWRGVA